MTIDSYTDIALSKNPLTKKLVEAIDQYVIKKIDDYNFNLVITIDPSQIRHNEDAWKKRKTKLENSTFYGQIDVFSYQKSDEQLFSTLIHELGHHLRWMSKGDDFVEYLSEIRKQNEKNSEIILKLRVLWDELSAWIAGFRWLVKYNCQDIVSIDELTKYCLLALNTYCKACSNSTIECEWLMPVIKTYIHLFWKLAI